jgi:Rrf2 family iron-sulfur cluster assembly transcriptional regulator
LARKAEQVSVADIIIAVDEPLDATQCGGKGNCRGEDASRGRCMTHDLWTSLNQKMVEYLSSVSLADLVKQQEGRVHVHGVRETKIKLEAPRSSKSSSASAKKEIEAKKKPLANSVFTFAQQIN